MRLSPLWSEYILWTISILKFAETCFRAQRMFYFGKCSIRTFKNTNCFCWKQHSGCQVKSTVFITLLRSSISLLIFAYLFLQALEVSVCPRRIVELFCFDLPASFCLMYFKVLLFVTYKFETKILTPLSWWNHLYLKVALLCTLILCQLCFSEYIYYKYSSILLFKVCYFLKHWITIMYTCKWKKHKLESRLPGEISKPQICRWHHPYGRKWRGTKEPLDESESGEWKSWLKAQHSENKDRGIRSHHFMGNRWVNSGNSVRLYFSGLQNHCTWWLQPWN